MSTYNYKVWYARGPTETAMARTGFEARKAFAEKHGKPVSECMARRVYNDPRVNFSDGTSIRNEP